MQNIVEPFSTGDTTALVRQKLVGLIEYYNGFGAANGASRWGDIRDLINSIPGPTFPDRATDDVVLAALQARNLSPIGNANGVSLDFANSAYFSRGETGASMGALAEYIVANGAFSRGSNATYFDADGIMQTAGPNVLRLDHDPVSRQALGVLIERQAINLQIYSEDATRATGVNGGAASLPVITANAGIAPDGSMTADRIDFALNGGIASGDIAQMALPAVAISTGISYAASIWVRTIDDSVKLVRIVSPTGLAKLATITGVWRRFLVLNTSNITGNSTFRLRLRGNETTDDSASLLVWGAQFEEGTDASSYIKTNASAVTRLADSQTYARAGTLTGTIVIDGHTAPGINGDQTFWCWDDNTTGNRIRLMRDADRVVRWIVTVGGVDVINLDMGAVADNTDLKVSASWGGVNAASLNGSLLP